MKIYYRNTIYLCFLLFFASLSASGQQEGIVSTERSSGMGIVSFSQSSKLSGIGDTKFVDGYVRKYGTSSFIFPVGHKGSYRPFATESDGVTGAYYQDDPGTASSRIGGPFATSSFESSITTVSNKEFWEISGDNPSRITLTWNANSAVGQLTDNSLKSLSIVGWNKNTARWEKIASRVDELSLLGGSSTLANGSITTLQSVSLNNYIVYTLGNVNSGVLASNYIGSLELVSCSEIKGWVWDKNYPDVSLVVELMEGNTVHATTTASDYRGDLKSQGTGTGKYGFRFVMPESLNDGNPHELSVRVRSSTYMLAGSPKSVSCSYEGKFELANCSTIKGWVWDKNNPNTSLKIELVEDGVVLATSVASVLRSDLNRGTNKYGFSFSLPTALKDGRSHTLSVKIQNINFTLPGSPKSLTCAAVQYAGLFDAATCDTLKGWVWDKNYPLTPLTVEIFEGSTVYATTKANLYRADLKNAGIGSTGNYAFKIVTPLEIKDGQTHQLSVRVKGSNYILGNSPKTLTCATQQFAGLFDAATCDTLKGWVWDKNNPSTSLDVEIFEGNTVYATTTANLYRADLKNAGAGSTGNYAFKIVLPVSVKDGQTHQLSARVKGSNYILGASPKTVTCATQQFAGLLDAATCDTVRGWVWDKNNPSTSLDVEIFEGSTVYATTTANLYRADLKNAGAGSTGNYAFKILLPVSVKDGQTHQLSARVKGSNYILGNSPKTVTCATQQFAGLLDAATCDTVRGWVWDKNNPSTSLDVEIFEGSTVYATTTANLYRADLKNAGAGSTGNYAFKILLPVSVKDGQTHQLSARVKGSNYILGASPKTVTCATQQFAGLLDAVTCDTIRGWVWDKNSPSSSLVVEIFEGSTVYATTTANQYRADLKSAGAGSTGNYAFKILLPVSVKDGETHQLSARVKGSNYILGNAPKTVTCATQQFAGLFDAATCDTLKGWVWDKNSPSTSLVVEIFEGSTVYATTTANLYRADLKNAGAGSTGNYAFKIVLPASIKDGQTHQLSARVKGSTYILGNSPRTVTCAAQQFRGIFDAADCNSIRGWVWDKNNPASTLNVEIFEGTRVYATAVANLFRADLINAGAGSTGNYMFKIPLPASLKDGQLHQLSVRVQGSSYVLANSPKSITCVSNARLSASDETLFDVEQEEGDHMNLDLSVYPNPTSGKCTLHVKWSKVASAKITVRNILGQKIFEDVLLKEDGTQDKIIDLSGQANGIYLIQLVTENESLVKRVVLAR